MKRSFSITLFLALAALLCACESAPEKPTSVAKRDTSVDFSGSWEMDYGRSDDLDQRLSSIYKELQRQAERRARSGGSDRGGILRQPADLRLHGCYRFIGTTGGLHHHFPGD